MKNPSQLTIADVKQGEDVVYLGRMQQFELGRTGYIVAPGDAYYGGTKLKLLPVRYMNDRWVRVQGRSYNRDVDTACTYQGKYCPLGRTSFQIAEDQAKADLAATPPEHIQTVASVLAKQPKPMTAYELIMAYLDLPEHASTAKEFAFVLAEQGSDMDDVNKVTCEFRRIFEDRLAVEAADAREMQDYADSNPENEKERKLADYYERNC